MPKQLHKNFVDEQEKIIIKSNMDKKIKINYILSILGIKRRRFFNFTTLFNSNLFNTNICFKVPDSLVLLREFLFYIKGTPQVDKSLYLQSGVFQSLF